MDVRGCPLWLRDGRGPDPGLAQETRCLPERGSPREGVGWSPNQVAPGWVKKPRSMPPLPLWLWVGPCRIRKH